MSCLILEKQNDVLFIDTWVMSCRVLKRGVEQCMLNQLCLLAKKRRLKAVRGEYIPTSKNELVRDHYARLGFTRMRNGNSGAIGWELRLTGDWQPLPHFIKEETNDGTIKE